MIYPRPLAYQVRSRAQPGSDVTDRPHPPLGAGARLHRIGNRRIQTQTRPLQKVPAVGPAQVDPPGRAREQRLDRIHQRLQVQRREPWQTQLPGPHIAGAAGQHSKSHLAAGYAVDHLVDRPIAADDKYRIQPLVPCLPRELRCFTGILGLMQRRRTIVILEVGEDRGQLRLEIDRPCAWINNQHTSHRLHLRHRMAIIPELVASRKGPILFVQTADFW